ncbi:MAG TPA: hypothetical protein VMF89_25475, partial [Polyangiales bacterium]|nr:hypothetical protein [Polyangiales bacterium]
MSDKQGVSSEASDSGQSVAEDDATSRTMTANVADACDEPGMRSCSADDARVPLLCEASRWQAQTACGPMERCETEQGADLGKCVPIASECLSHAPDQEFCVGDLIRSCEDLVLSKGRRCEQSRRCMELGGSAQCVCAEGWVDDGSGAGCQMPTSCTSDNGGCDSLTQCSQSNGPRVCSACPPGYEGTGETGCFPQLLTLTAEPGALAPELSPDMHAYRVRLPLLQQSVLVTTSAAENVRINFNDDEQAAPASGWQSPPLPLGEHKVEIKLTTPRGRESKYELVIERTGVQEAYVKAADPDAADELGGSIAVWGDPMAVGVYKEDSSSTRGDAVNNDSEDSGAVRVYVRDGNTWTEQAYLKADPPI